MDELLNTFGQTIKTARQAAGLTQEELAEQVGITARYIMAIENENKQPSMKVLTKIIRALKISADTIFFPETQHIDKKKEHLFCLPINPPRSNNPIWTGISCMRSLVS